MRARLPLLACGAALGCGGAAAQELAPVCHPRVGAPVTVASARERPLVGREARPPLTDAADGFAWPDTPLGVARSGAGYRFFGSDGGLHARQVWMERHAGNGKYGSVVTTAGTLDDPLGAEPPLDVSIAPNPNPSVNPNYFSYSYMGGGPVFQVPAGMTGEGGLLLVYHAEVPPDALYAVLGLAGSRDGGLHWTDLGEAVRLNQAFASGLDGFEIGDGRLVLSPDGEDFYLCFPDSIADGTPHRNRTTNVSVARAPAAELLAAAFGPGRQSAVPFSKYYEGRWDLQPGIGGASTDLIPKSPTSGYIDVHRDAALGRYVMVISDDTVFSYAESVDGLSWTVPAPIGTYGGPAIAAYPTAVGTGADPGDLGLSFYVYFTHLPNDGTGWTNATLERLTVDCL